VSEKLFWAIARLAEPSTRNFSTEKYPCPEKFFQAKFLKFKIRQSALWVLNLKNLIDLN
jgi:hypothetical protein